VVNRFEIENEDSRTCFLVEKLSLSKFLTGFVALFARCLQGLHARWFRA
jgi:hypothetical protein